MRFRRFWFAMGAVGIGVCAGGLVLAGLMEPMKRWLASPEVVLSRWAIGAWAHAVIGLSSLAAGVAAAWLRCRDDPKDPQYQRLGGQYGLGVAGAWSAVVICALWRPALLAWPLFALDFLLVALAGVTGQRMSRRV